MNKSIYNRSISKMEVAVPDRVPLRYYRGWGIQFNTATERFDSPILCLFGFLSVPDLERAIDASGRAVGRS